MILFPVFTAFAKLSINLFGKKILYIYFAIISFIYVFSLYKISLIATKYKPTILRLFFFFIFFTVLVGTKKYLSYGVARQYLLGTYFQPSSFGILILLSIYLFLKKRNFQASVMLAFASTFHPTYLLVSLFIFAGYLFVLFREDKTKAFKIAVFQLVSVLPVTIYSFITFSSTSPEITAQAKDILVNFRIPHHAKFDCWFGLPDVYRITITLISLIIIRKTRLFPVIAIAFGLSATLTFAQVISGSNGLALLFPWRVSVVLVPISASIIIASAIQIISARFKKIGNKKIILPIQIILFLLIFGLTIPRIKHFSNLFSENHNKHEKIYSWIKNNSESSNLYLIPKEQSDFRIKTETPILADRKSHPYKDVEVIEWHKRLQISDRYFNSDTDSCNTLKSIIEKYGVTHIYSNNKSKTTVCPQMQKIFSDSNHAVYRIKSGNSVVYRIE